MNNRQPITETLISANNPAHQVLMVLFYFDIFSYPLTRDEVRQFCREKITDTQLFDQALNELIDKGLISLNAGFYQLNDLPAHITEREASNVRAERYLEKARRMTKLIARFPFTRAVFISGSLSKNVMPVGGDIDYFIVTHPGRLWICRTLLVIFKKLFLLNSHKYFCVNYFVDENHLEIEEKNLFTATEIVTLLPMYHEGIFRQFHDANRWTASYFPNFPTRNIDAMLPADSFWLKSALEGSMGGWLGDSLDAFFMKNTLQYWNKKFSTLDPEQFAIALKSRRYVSKHHPQGFQQRVLDALKGRISNFEQRHGIRFEFNEDML